MLDSAGGTLSSAIMRLPVSAPEFGEFWSEAGRHFSRTPGSRWRQILGLVETGSDALHLVDLGALRFGDVVTQREQFGVTQSGFPAHEDRT